jgi:hypothetical protein
MDPIPLLRLQKQQYRASHVGGLPVRWPSKRLSLEWDEIEAGGVKNTAKTAAIFYNRL